MRAAEIDDGTDRTAAFEALFRAEGERLWRALVAFTGGRAALAEDAVAEAFARALVARDEIRDPARWIYRVAVRVVIDEVRREARQRPETNDSAVDGPALSDAAFLLWE